MAVWYAFKPIDTLFFRGAEPLEKASNHRSTTLFPPSTGTITGALRTAYLHEKGISFKEYTSSHFDDNETIQAIGKAGDSSPWDIIGPLIQKKKQLYIPAPYTWYVAKDIFEDNKKEKKLAVEIYKARYIDNKILSSSSGEKKLWVKAGKEELIALGGKWIDKESLHKGNPVEILEQDSIFRVEPRTGIEIDKSKRTVMEGHLFTMDHCRLLPDISLVFGISRNPGLPERGFLQLGGEQRFGKYKKCDIDLDMDVDQKGFFVSLSLVDGTIDFIKEYVVATGKAEYRGGWDLKRKFHKPLKGYYPAGTVLIKNINGNCLYMEEKDE